MSAVGLETWSGENASIDDVHAAISRLRIAASPPDRPPPLRTSVMTHMAWVPEEWVEAARTALSGMAERHPSRTILLVPEPDSGRNEIDASVSVECYAIPGAQRQICTEVVELRLRGLRAKAPASVAAPLLISDLPVFLRWRGEPPWGATELEQLVGITDRLILDSTEWDDLPYPYRHVAELFDRVSTSDIAWERTSRWRSLLASLWPDIENVRTLRVHGTPAQAWLLAGWLRARLGRDDIDVEIDVKERLEGIDLDGVPAPFPPGDPPPPSEVLSEELDLFTREPVYEQAVRAAVA